jgi:diadenylate cyclase
MITLEGKSRVQHSIGMAVGSIAREIDANVVVTLTRINPEVAADDAPSEIKAVVFRKMGTSGYLDDVLTTKLSKSFDSSMPPIKDLLRDMVANKTLQMGDRVICVGDETVGVGYSGLIFVLDVDEIFFKCASHRLTENIDPSAFDAVVGIAMELAKEGREGRKVGTAFIIADPEEIKEHTRQMVMNPFAGHPPDKRRVQDPMLNETVKEFAQLDGVFILSRDGMLVSAGTYINIDARDVELAEGFGTKHRNCAALTKAKDALAIVVSESGVVRIFKEGKILARLT